MDRFNRISNRVVRVEVDIPGFDLGRSTQAYRKRLAQSKRATQPSTSTPPTTTPAVQSAQPPCPPELSAITKAIAPAPLEIDMDAELVVFGDERQALAAAAARLAPFAMEL